MGFIADIIGGKDSPPAARPESPVSGFFKAVVDSSVAKARAKQRRARLAGAKGKGLLSGGFKGYGDKDTLGG